MKAVFADSFYFFALLNERDPSHQEARAFSETFTGPIITTDWIITELGDGLAKSQWRRVFADLSRDLLSNLRIQVVPAERELLEQGIALYSDRLDKEWSLTDCTSFVVMNQNDILEALTGDHHFEQAGFVALLKQ
jgi:predicted nucleic acid-binding protein